MNKHVRAWAYAITLGGGAIMVSLTNPSSALAAEPYPNKPVKIVIPFPAGQTTDNLARALAAQLGKLAGQPFVVENRPGANASIGANMVARSAPDGYTLILGTNSPMAGNLALFKSLPYDPVRDFQPVAQVATTGWVIATAANSKYKDMRSVIEASKAQPGSVSVGGGTTGYQMTASIIARNAGVEFNVIPYNGSPQLATDVIGGSVDALVSDIGSALPLIRAGKLRALAVLSDERLKWVPDVPTLSEQGFGKVELLYSWLGLFGPAGMPPEVTARLADMTGQAMQSEEMGRLVEDLFMLVDYTGAQKLQDVQRRDIENYRTAMTYTGRAPQ